MIAAIIEAGQAPALRRLHVTALVVILCLLPLARGLSLMLPANAGLATDFDVFHLGARAILAGDLERLYDFAWFKDFQRATFGREFNAPFSYPPTFALAIAPFGLVARGAAFILFIGLTLAGFLRVLPRLGRESLPAALSLLLLPIFGVVIFGQNGLLTGALAGLACLGLAGRRRWAGVPIGLLIIKPHLAIGFAVYVIVNRDWRSFLTAGAVAGGVAALSALIFGLAAWQGFFTAAANAGRLLPTGFFPFYRMVSVYAAVRSWGAPATLATLAQVASAVLALAAIIIAQRRLPPRQAVGITAIATLLFSPYAYDYDLLIAGSGLALLLPDLLARGSPAARSTLYGLFLFAAGYGLALRTWLGEAPRAPADLPIALAAVGLVGCLAMVWRVLQQPESGA